VRAVLQPLGANIVGEAEDGRGCLEKITEAEPDLVLLDVKMPGMGGLEALPELRVRVPEAKVVVLSTASPIEHEQRSLELGATAYVQKPRDVFRLPDALRSALAGA